MDSRREEGLQSCSRAREAAAHMPKKPSQHRTRPRQSAPGSKSRFDRPHLSSRSYWAFCSDEYDQQPRRVSKTGLGVYISQRAGIKLQIEGEAEAAARARDVIDRALQSHRCRGRKSTPAMVDGGDRHVFRSRHSTGIIRQDVAEPPKVMIRTRKKTIVPRVGDSGDLYGGTHSQRHHLRVGTGRHGQDLPGRGAGSERS